MQQSHKLESDLGQVQFESNLETSPPASLLKSISVTNEPARVFPTSSNVYLTSAKSSHSSLTDHTNSTDSTNQDLVNQSQPLDYVRGEKASHSAQMQDPIPSDSRFMLDHFNLDSTSFHAVNSSSTNPDPANQSLPLDYERAEKTLHSAQMQDSIPINSRRMCDHLVSDLTSSFTFKQQFELSGLIGKCFSFLEIF